MKTETLEKRLAVFDVDGTLVDSLEHILTAMHAAAGDLDLPKPDDQAVRAIVGLSLEDAAAGLYPNEAKAVHLALVKHYRQSFCAMVADKTVVDRFYEGAKDALDHLESQGWLMALATSKARRGVQRMLDEQGWNGRFVAERTADDGPCKPHPAMLVDAMAIAQTAPERTVMIGDTAFDMQMAKAAGTKAIGVAWGYHDTEVLWDAGADRVIESFAELPQVIQQALA